MSTSALTTPLKENLKSNNKPQPSITDYKTYVKKLKYRITQLESKAKGHALVGSGKIMDINDLGLLNEKATRIQGKVRQMIARNVVARLRVAQKSENRKLAGSS